MRIAISITNVFRDLSGALLLISELCRRGATCYLVLKSKESKLEFLSLAPDFVLLPHLRRNRAEFLNELLDCGIQVGVLDAEGGVLSSFDWYGEALVSDKSLRERVSCFCLWGPKLAQHAIAQGWYEESQVYVTGAPRFDFYTAPWLDVALPDAPCAKEFKKPLILINGRFSWANPARRTPQIAAEGVMKLRGYSPERTQEMLACQQRGMQALVELTNTIAARFPQITFVYRPHPFERLETYHDLLDLEKLPNLRLERQGEIQNWLRMADGVIQRGCTTAIEAGMLGIPAFSPDWIETAEPIEIVEEVSVHCANLAELEAHLTALQSNCFEIPSSIVDAHQQVVTDWFHKIDGQAYRRVAAAIEESYANKRMSDQPLPHKDVQISRCRAMIEEASSRRRRSPLSQFIKQVKGKIRSALPEKDPQQEHDDRKSQAYRQVDLAQIRELLNNLKTVGNHGDGGSITVSWADATDSCLENKNAQSFDDIVKFEISVQSSS